MQQRQRPNNLLRTRRLKLVLIQLATQNLHVRWGNETESNPVAQAAAKTAVLSGKRIVEHEHFETAIAELKRPDGNT